MLALLNRLRGRPNPFRYRYQLMPYYLPRWMDKSRGLQHRGCYVRDMGGNEGGRGRERG